MTGRQFARIGVPGVFGPTVNTGLPLNETTVANQVKKQGYATGYSNAVYETFQLIVETFVSLDEAPCI
jgi:arylsulfatase A-like enzyme